MEDQTYQDDDFIYVDPDTRTAIGRVEWTTDGVPQPLQRREEKKEEEEKTSGRRKERERKRYYPWGTYRTMKRIYKLEGKEKTSEPSMSLDEALQKAIQEPYWD